VILSLLAVLALPTWRAEILEGVRTVASPGIPGPVAVFGAKAEPIVVGLEGSNVQAAVVAVAERGRSRYAALGHEGYFGQGALAVGDTGRLIENLVRWAARNRSGARVLTAGLPDVNRFLASRGWSVQEADLDQPLSGDVLVMAVRKLDPRQRKNLRRFLREGGSLIAGGPAWGFLQLNPNLRISDHPINPFLAEAGLALADGMTQGTLPGGLYDATLEPLPEVHALKAAEELLSDRLAPDRRAQAAASILQAAACLPEREANLRPMLARIRSTVRGAVVPSASEPVRADQPLRRVALALEVQEAMTLPPERVKPHPAAAVFPGAVPADAPRVSRTIELEGRHAGWISTGLYAAPGEKLTVEVSPQTAGLGLSLRIGCHSDTLWHLDRWERAPEVTRVFPISQPKTVAANAFGGLVYVVVPDRGAPAGTKLTVRGAVEAPLYVKGKTSLQEWRERIRKLPAPWAELQAENMIVTVHASAVRNLEDPDAVCQVYDDASDAQADLAGIPRARRVPERFVVDQQISAGWMHSGYPIMAYTVGISELSVDSKRLREAPHGETWGHWHELGHNHQSDLWTFEGTVEVTNNVFTLYTMERVSGKKWWQSTHPAMAREETAKRLGSYLEAGAPFERWKSDPFLALTMYVQVVDAFGWDAIREAIASYHKMPPSERPRTDDQKRDAWMRALSRATGRNMGPFFRAWGVPVSDEAVQAVANLPEWLPAELRTKSAEAGG